MCERIIALLFHLYPRAFRARYLREALLLCRDRRRHETGIYVRLRLACDLMVDFFAGLPTAWQNSYAAAATQPQDLSGRPVPAFRTLQSEPLRPGSILLGGIVTCAVFSFFVLILRTTAIYPIERHALSPIERVMQRLNQPAAPSAQKVDVQKHAAKTSAPADSRPPHESAESTVADLQKRIAAPPSLSPRGGAAMRSSAVTLPAQGGVALAGGSKHRSNTPSNSMAGSVPAASATGARENAATAHQPVKPEDATQAMIEAISAHQIVMFGETHGNKQEYEWLCKLLAAPAFADHVDDIVVEFGNALYQKTVDRYIAGEDVPQAQIEKAWRNMIGAVGPVSPVYGRFYRAVRESNLERRGRHKIRLLLGDPYGDWDKIRSAEDLGPYLGHRDEWYAEVVKKEVLAHHHRALLIMGAGHFVRRNGPDLIEQAIRAAGVQPYLVVFGTNAVGGYDDLDHRFDRWPLPAIVPLSGNWVGALPANPVLTGGNVAAGPQKMEDVADAMLYLGPRDTLTQVFVPRSDLVDTAYGREIERRLTIQTGHTMDFTEAREGPQYQRPLKQTISTGIHRLPPNPPRSAGEPLPPRPPSQ